MANDLNRWQGIGRLARDPETRYTTAGQPIANITVACGSQWKDKTTGQKQEAVEWVRCVAFGKLAEIMQQYLKKGAQVFVEGAMRTRKWQDKDGKDKYSTEIVLDTMRMLGGKREDGGAARAEQQAAAYSPPTTQPQTKPNADFDDDIPF